MTASIIGVALFVILCFVIIVSDEGKPNQAANTVFDKPKQNTNIEIEKIWEDDQINKASGDEILETVQKLQSLLNQLETEKEPSILVNIKSEIEVWIKHCIELKRLYPKSIYKLKDAEENLQQLNERYNYRLFITVKEALKDYMLKMSQSISEQDKDSETESMFEKIQYYEGFLEKSAKNYQESVKAFTEFHDTVEDLYSNQMNNDLELSEAFSIIIEKALFRDYNTEIVKLICNNELSKENINHVLKDFYIHNIKDIKLDLLDLSLSYINFVLDKHIITEKESKNINILKLYFRIKEGDFYKLRYNEIQSICQNQSEKFSISYTDYNEELFWVKIQDMFDLSYSQLEKLKTTKKINL